MLELVTLRYIHFLDIEVLAEIYNGTFDQRPERVGARIELSRWHVIKRPAAKFPTCVKTITKG